VFALFDLLGLRFIPRLRDAGDLLLYRLGVPTGLPVDRGAPCPRDRRYPRAIRRPAPNGCVAQVRRHLVIGSRAQIPADEDDHRCHALCLQILVNAVQVWNARYLTASIEQLQATKPDVVADETAIALVAPVSHVHVNSLGHYDLHRQRPPAGHLRPLRRAGEGGGPGVLAPPLGVSGNKH
jgi:hypothetical protein